MAGALSLLAAAVTIAVGYLVARTWLVRSTTLRRLYADEAIRGVGYEPVRSLPERWLAGYLAKAGYRAPGVPAVFLGLTAACAAAGLLFSQFYRVALLPVLVGMVAGVPGGVGDLMTTVLTAGPWTIALLAALVPMLVVRAVRRRRVLEIERDLPLALELFATMGEAGLGFDAALGKVVRARDANRPLMAEFTGFQLDMLAGTPRAQALRQLARRVDVPSLTGFTISLIQAEQVGASMSETLRHQADDLRERRRENALLQAQALPVKLVFPLVICFLPGVFVSTLAPVLFQMIQVANSALGAGR